MTETTKLDGVLNISGGTYDNLNIDGVCNCTGDLEATVLDVDGILNCDGNIQTGLLDCDGVSNIRGDIRAEEIRIDGVINFGKKTHAAKVEANSIYCNGVLSCGDGMGTTSFGEISADIVEAEGFIRAREIHGDKVVIRSKRSVLMRWLQRRFSKVGVIEATNVELIEVYADVVNGHDITIGPRCEIGTLDCSGTLAIDPSASIGTITGDYTKR